MGSAPVFIGAELDSICGEALRTIERRFVCDGISIFEVSVPPTLLRFAATKTIARDQLQGFRLRWQARGDILRCGATCRGLSVSSLQMLQTGSQRLQENA